MNEHIIKTIEQISQEISEIEKPLLPKKILVNQLCEIAGVPKRYSDLDENPSEGRFIILRNAFYNKPLSSCIREYLEMRSNLPVKEATLDEIFSALKEGGYDFRSSGDREDDQKRGVAIALGKNSQTFHRLPTGDFGLTTWYPGVREKRQKTETSAQADKPEEQQTIILPESASQT